MPRPGRGTGGAQDRLCAVYASAERAFATAFALPLLPSADGRTRWSLDYRREIPRITIHAGSLDLSRVGYLYRVPAAPFRRLDDLQWVAEQPVTPIDYEIIEPATFAHWIAPPPRVPAQGLVQGQSAAFRKLWEHVTAQFPGPRGSIHGVEHWRRVERNGLMLAASTGADATVVRLFALFHDSRRINDGTDPQHGARGASLARALRGTLYDVSDDAFDLLQTACTYHTDGERHEDPTIGTCWDADRLDLTRVGVTLDPRFMSTRLGQEMTRATTDPEGNWIDTYGEC
jgi:uncharacterized protein